MASDLIVVFPLSIQKLYNFVRPSEKDIYNNCNKMLANTTNNASSNDSKMKIKGRKLIILLMIIFDKTLKYYQTDNLILSADN